MGAGPCCMRYASLLVINTAQSHTTQKSETSRRAVKVARGSPGVETVKLTSVNKGSDILLIEHRQCMSSCAACRTHMAEEEKRTSKEQLAEEPAGLLAKEPKSMKRPVRSSKSMPWPLSNVQTLTIHARHRNRGLPKGLSAGQANPTVDAHTHRGGCC